MSYNEKSRENLVPFRKGEDSRRMKGRRKGSINQASLIKQMLSENMDPDMIFSATVRGRFKNITGKTYMSAVTTTLINQSLEGNTQATNLLLRELRKYEEKETRGFFANNPHKIQFVTVNSREELERLDKIKKKLEDKYGDDYEELLERD